MFPRSLGQISRPCSTSILRFVFCKRHLICLFAFKLLPCTADNLTISNYLHCLFVDLRSVNHHLFVNLATIELVRADLHIWTQLQVCHLFPSSILCRWKTSAIVAEAKHEGSDLLIIPWKKFQKEWGRMGVSWANWKTGWKSESDFQGEQVQVGTIAKKLLQWLWDMLFSYHSAFAIVQTLLFSCWS